MTGHIPPWPGTKRGLRHLATIGLISRSVVDFQLVLPLIARPDRVEWHVPPLPIRYARSERTLKSRRIAWTAEFPGVPIDTEIRAGLEQLATELEQLGCVVEQCAPREFSIFEACELFGRLFAAELHSTMPSIEDQRSSQDLTAKKTEEPFSRGYALGIAATMFDYSEILHERNRIIGILEKFFQDWDAWLCPVAPTVAYQHCPSGSPLRVNDQEWPYLAQGWFCLPFSLTHHPVVTIPVSRSRDGLPYGVQVVGKLWGESDLLVVAEQLARIIGPFPVVDP